jgi:hypothetical protein
MEQRMIAQRFEFTRDFPKAWNNSVYFQLRTSVPFRGEMSCGFKAYRILLSLLTGTPYRYIHVGKDQARFCPSGEKCGPERG